MFASFLSGMGLKLMAVLGAIGALVGLYFKVRESGVEAQKAADTKVTLQHVEVAHEVQTEVARLPDAAVADGLREFTRPE